MTDREMYELAKKDAIRDIRKELEKEGIPQEDIDEYINLMLEEENALY